MSLIIFLTRVHVFSMTWWIRSINDDMITLPRKVVSIALGEVMYSEMVIKFENFPLKKMDSVSLLIAQKSKQTLVVSP